MTWNSLLELMYIATFWELENIPIKYNQYNQITNTIWTVIILKKAHNFKSVCKCAPRNLRDNYER